MADISKHDTKQQREEKEISFIKRHWCHITVGLLTLGAFIWANSDSTAPAFVPGNALAEPGAPSAPIVNNIPSGGIGRPATRALP